MKVVNANTQLGKRLVAISQNYEGTELYQVYDKWSTAKQVAWDKCYDEYRNTDGASNFSICSHNSFCFTCKWFTQDGMRLETRNNSYLVVFDN